MRLSGLAAAESPEDEPELSRQWRIRSVRLEDRDSTEDVLARAVGPIDPDEKRLETDVTDRQE
ncbi:hypothetical protein [Halopiger thermotolerans]